MTAASSRTPRTPTYRPALYFPAAAKPWERLFGSRRVGRHRTGTSECTVPAIVERVR